MFEFPYHCSLKMPRIQKELFKSGNARYRLHVSMDYGPGQQSWKRKGRRWWHYILTEKATALQLLMSLLFVDLPIVYTNIMWGTQFHIFICAHAFLTLLQSSRANPITLNTVINQTKGVMEYYEQSFIYINLESKIGN